MRKTDPRIVALGDLDEAQSTIGVARAMAPRSTLGRELLELQRGLYLAMAEVAVPSPARTRLAERLDAAALGRLDHALEAVRKKVRIARRFVIPGETPVAAAVDHARTVTRRAERAVVACVDAGTVPGEVLLPWLNRASDLLFVLARVSERAPRPSKASKTTRRATR